VARTPLELLLGDFSKREFFGRHYGRLSLHRQADDPDRFRSLVTLEDLERCLSFSAGEHEEFVQSVGGLAAQEPDATPARHCSAQTAINDWLAGKSLVFNGIDRRLPAISAFSRALEGELKCSVWCNLYLTPGRGYAFATHYDTHDVFVLQVLGTKQWRLGPAAVESPLPFQDRVGGPDIAQTHQSLTLRPGDVLYIPRGLLHDATAQEHLSCHITVGVHPKTYLDLILAAVAIAADRDSRFRKYLPLGSFAVGETEIETARELLRSVSSDDYRQAGNAFCELLASERRRDATGVFRLPEEADTLSAADRFQAVPNLMYSLSVAEEGIELIAFGRSISLPIHAEDALSCCLSGKVFTVAELAGFVNPVDKTNFVRRLFLEGIVRRIDADENPAAVAVDFVRNVKPS
jgi:ribosomal protein L16 Arg81 hydroxylase